MSLISIHRKLLTSASHAWRESNTDKKKFPDGRNKRSDEPLGLVHSDVCGKMNANPLSGGEYCLTLLMTRLAMCWLTY